MHVRSVHYVQQLHWPILSEHQRVAFPQELTAAHWMSARSNAVLHERDRQAEVEIEQRLQQIRRHFLNLEFKA